MNLAGRNMIRMMGAIWAIISSAIVLAATSITVAAAEPYTGDVNSIKMTFVTLAFIIVFLQLPFGITLYTYTNDKYVIIRKLHRTLGYILLFLFMFTTILCVANYDVGIYTIQISAHIIAGITGAIVFPLKIGTVRNYGGYTKKSMIYGSILFIVFFMLYVTTRI